MRCQKSMMTACHEFVVHTAKQTQHDRLHHTLSEALPSASESPASSQLSSEPFPSGAPACAMGPLHSDLGQRLLWQLLVRTGSSRHLAVAVTNAMSQHVVI